jgi:uncharacterized protein YkwD
VPSVWLVAAALGCGDGIGRPIVSAGVSAAAGAGTAGSGVLSGGNGGMAGSATALAGMPGHVSGAGGMPFPPSGAGEAGRLERPSWEDWPDDREGPDRNDPDGMPAVPEGTYCEPVADWDEADADAERGLFQALNFAREGGFVACGEGDSADVRPLAMRPELRCAARLHSLDMSVTELFDHVIGGVGPEERMRQAGYTFRVAAESIARDEAMVGGAPYEVLTRLVAAEGADCKNILDPAFDSVGIGRYEDLWTLDFAGP